MSESDHNPAESEPTKGPDIDANEMAERQADFESKGTPIDAEDTAASKFRQEIAAKKSNLDDYEPEENLWQGGYSPKAMIGSWIGMVVLTIAAMIAAFMIEQLPVFWTFIAMLVLWAIVICIYLQRRLGVRYQLTTQRFIHQTGILTRKTDRIEIIDIDDVSYSQGPIQRAFGIGTIVLTGSDRTHPELKMSGIAKVKDVSGLIDDIRRKERRRRALHIETI